MTKLLNQLFYDLLQRFRFLRDELAGTTLGEPDIAAYRDRLLTQIERSIETVQSLIGDLDQMQPEFARNMYHACKRLTEYAQLADEGPVSTLSRFQPRDLFLTRLVAAMCDEFHFPHARPLCSAITTQYYCILPRMDLILIPHSEADHLLGLPDIYHELGHLLFRGSAALIEKLRSCSQAHFQNEIVRAERESWPAASIEELRAYSLRWSESWVVEFGCDLLATYVCGPAFGWTNTRLCARLSPEFFETTASHPADAARTIAIRLMLQNQGHIREAHQIDLQWDELQQTSGQREPQGFRLAFPDVLLTKVVKEVVAYAQSVDIKAFDAHTMPIAALLNESWRQFLPNPSAFRSWEAVQVESLKARLVPGSPNELTLQTVD
jgi:hypothetical protein